jgi:hypothetical protein
MEFSRLLLLLPLALEGNSMHGILPAAAVPSTLGNSMHGILPAAAAAAAAAHRSQCGNSKKVPKSFAKN